MAALRASNPRQCLLILVALMALAFLVIGVYYYAFWMEYRQVPFDSDIWKSPRGNVRDLQIRRPMIRDIVTRILPGKTRDQIEAVLGPSPMPDEARAEEPLSVSLNSAKQRRARSQRERAGPDAYDGSYFDELEYGWDMAYWIGKPRIAFNPMDFDVSGGEHERLLIRLDDNNKFDSWYIVGDTDWAWIVGEPGNRSFRETRQSTDAK